MMNLPIVLQRRNRTDESSGESKMAVREFRCTVPLETARYFEDLFFAAIFSSSYLTRPNGLDGVTYELLFDRGLYTAEFWSPKEGTNCYRLECVLKMLYSAVENNDADAIKAMVPEVVELTDVFRKLFPEELKGKEFCLPSYRTEL